MQKKRKLPKNNQDLKVLSKILVNQIAIDSYLVRDYQIEIGRLLVCYVVLTDSSPITLLKDQITQHLPEQFPPFIIIPVIHIPYQDNGEIDYKQLLAVSILNSSRCEVVEKQILQLPNVKQADRILDEIKHLHLSELLPDKLLFDSTVTTVASGVNASVFSNKLLADLKMMAISYGGELHVPKNSPKTLTSALLETVAKYPTKGISCIDENGQKIFLTYPELLVQAKCILAGLRKRGCRVGDCAILQMTQLHNHFVAFWGCILGGVIPVVINVAQNYHEKNALTDKFFNVYSLLRQPIIITDNSIEPDISKLALLYQLPTLQI